MKLARYSVGGAPRLGIVGDAGVIDIGCNETDVPADMIALIEGWADWQDKLSGLADRRPDHAFSDVTFHAPIARPGKILGIGLNYADHVAESGMEKPADQMWFAKMGTSVADPYGAIPMPRVSTMLDYEAELVVVIGTKAKHIPRDAAATHIFGYCVGNDVSVRDWQLRTSQFTIGKSFDGHAPFGPWIVTADEIDSADLPITCYVNGERRQSSNTRHLVFDCADQIAFLSQAMTLEPGDILFTGTPGGVGAAMKPPRWLRLGDVVRVEIGGIGAIENRVQAEA